MWLRVQVKALTALVEQLKEEVAKRDRELQDEKYERALSEDERNKLHDQVNRLHAQVGQHQGDMDELRRQHRQCEEAVRELRRLQGEEAERGLAARTERDVIGTQLLRRNDEIELLRRKVGMPRTPVRIPALEVVFVGATRASSGRWRCWSRCCTAGSASWRAARRPRACCSWRCASCAGSGSC